MYRFEFRPFCGGAILRINHFGQAGKWYVSLFPFETESEQRVTHEQMDDSSGWSDKKTERVWAQKISTADEQRLF